MKRCNPYLPFRMYSMNSRYISPFWRKWISKSCRIKLTRWIDWLKSWNLVKLSNQMKVVLFIAIVAVAFSTCKNGEYFHETNTCICNQCYSGETCSQRAENCVIRVYHQQCTLCRDFWTSQSTRVNMSLDFQLRYQEIPLQDGLGPLLLSAIRKVHRLAGNCEISPDHHVVYGAGGTQLLHAFIYAFHKKTGQVLNVFSRAPYYEVWNSTNSTIVL